MSDLAGKVAFITGAARGQGRSHAVRLASEGVDIIAVDICENIPSAAYDMASPEDLAQTVSEVTEGGGRIAAFQADVRDREALQKAFDSGVAEFGGCDIVLANAGIIGLHPTDPQAFYDVMDVNLRGAWHTIEVAKQALLDRGPGGSIVVTNSTRGLRSVAGDTPGSVAYTASKHALVGLVRNYANTFAPHMIRVNGIHPTGVNTPMIMNPAMQEWFDTRPPTAAAMGNAMPVPYVETSDITNAVVWLVSDAARYVTGVALPIDAGMLAR
jgi:SDR family mycofactocin-dependent oxidoreductase